MTQSSHSACLSHSVLSVSRIKAINSGAWKPGAFNNIKTYLQSGSYSWVSLGYFAVNLSGGQPKMYWRLCCTGVKKLTYLLPNTRSTHTVKNYFPPMTVHRFAVDPQWNYDVTWNPRIPFEDRRAKVNIFLIKFRRIKTFVGLNFLSANFLQSVNQHSKISVKAWPVLLSLT